VIGGRLAFRFKHDRLLMMSSEAFSNVTAAKVQISVAQAKQAALDWMSSESKSLKVLGVESPAILPVLADGRAPSYRTVRAVIVATESPIGRWTVYVDAQTGSVVARKQTLMFATGTIQYKLSRAMARRPA